MKRILTILVLFHIIIFTLPLYAEEPGGTKTWLADFYVIDQDGNPVGGVDIELIVTTWYGDELDPDYYTCYKTGTTLSDGYGYLECVIPGDLAEGLESMRAYMRDPDYTVLSSQNTYTYSNQAIWPQFTIVYDPDGDLVDDNLELQLAEKFSPVLHKHSNDSQQGLADAEQILQDHASLKAWNNLGAEVYNSDMPPIHTWEFWYRCSFGEGQYPTTWRIDIDDNVRFQSAPAGQRPLYYHVYYESGFYYVQYWYFFVYNDLEQSTQNHTWHEGDWEHVSIKVEEVNGVFEPVKINFYQHEGGHTKTPAETWWSTYPLRTYGSLQQGYDENHTHLHVWIAANSHASYNRYDKVYHLEAYSEWLPAGEDYTDNCDYDPTGYDLYFPWDYLEKLGEINNESSAHGFTWFSHYEPIGPSKEWLAFIGRWGEYWWTTQTIGPIRITLASFSPLSPPFATTSPPNSHEWQSFTEDASVQGFGNHDQIVNLFGVTPDLINATFHWVDDPPDND